MKAVFLEEYPHGVSTGGTKSNKAKLHRQIVSYSFFHD
jgi:hypothetical protein